jgi:ribonuclease HII
MALLCGVDEAGRGPLAGPVTASAVVLPHNFPVEILRDSKQLNSRLRSERAAYIRRHARAWALGWASHAEIDLLNILQATLLAMRRALLALPLHPDEVVADGTAVPLVPYPVRALVRADATLPEVMAASILAKTARDAWMTDYARIEPRYGFERHMGYPTAEHRRCVRVYGPCPIHRRSFHVS